MSFKIEAPYPALATTTILPNPQLQDSVGSTGSIEIKRSMNGTKYSYVKSRDARRRLLWTFLLSYDKVLELQAFYDSYNSNQIKVTDHFDVVYRGYFTSNPFDFETLRRAASLPGANTIHQIQVEFEGFQIS